MNEGLCSRQLRCVVKFHGHSSLHKLYSPVRLPQKYWVPPGIAKASTPLRSKVHLSKINSFLQPVLHMLHDSFETPSGARLTSRDYKIITQLLINRVLPELDSLTSSEEVLRDVQSLTVRVALALLGSNVYDDDDDDEDTFADPRRSEIRDVILEWFNGKPTPWQQTLQKELKKLVSRYS